MFDKILNTCELFMSVLIPCIIIKDGTTFSGSIDVAKKNGGTSLLVSKFTNLSKITNDMTEMPEWLVIY